MEAPSPRPTSEDRVRAALWYAERGFGVFPCWSTTTTGRCRCPQGGRCSSPGKHPLTQNGFNDATTDANRIRTFLAAPSEPNYGLLPPEGVFVWDVDTDEERARLARLAESHGPLPATMHNRTANGEHVFLRWPDGLPRPLHKMFGLVTRWGTGAGAGYVIGPRSVHASGAEYAPAAGTVFEIATLPESWARAAVAGESDTIRIGGPVDPATVTAGNRHDFLRNKARLYAGTVRDPDALFAAVWAENEKLPEPKSRDEVKRAIGDALTKFPADPVAPEPVGPERTDLTGWRVLSEIVRVDPPPLLMGRWAPDGASILYGTGGVGKGRLAAQEIAGLTQSGELVLVVDYEDHEQEWRGRVEQCGGVLERVFLVAPFSMLWKAGGKTILDHSDVLSGLCRELGVTFVVIDSAMMAVPGIDVGDPTAPQQWAISLQKIGLPSLTLAHVIKNDADPAYPFGSVYWHNLARITWSLSMKEDQLWMHARKHNNYARPASLLLTEIAPDPATVTIGGGPFWSMTGHSQGLADRIVDLLQGSESSMTGAEIASELSAIGDPVKVNSVNVTLYRMVGKRVRREGDLWRVGPLQA